MQKLLWFGVLLILTVSCNSGGQSTENQTIADGIDSLEAVQEEPQRQEDKTTTDTIAFEVAFDRFFTALQTADTATINQFIHPEHGLWIIEQPGALPKMTQVKDITTFKREYQNRSFLTIREEVKTCDLKQEAWPTFDCADMDYEAGKSGYSKDGCFVASPGRFPKTGYWDYAGLQPDQIETIKATLPFVQKSVLHTTTSFEFHFGYLDGHWRLLFTKLIYPCSA